MRLIVKGRDESGWATVSRMLLPIVSALPQELVETKDDGKQAHARLTDAGNNVVDWIA